MKIDNWESNGLFHLISVSPPCRGYIYPCPWRIPCSKPFTSLKNSKIPSSKLFTPEEFHAQNPSPMTKSKLKPLYPWGIPSSKPFSNDKFQAQNPSPLKNSTLKTLLQWQIPSSKPFTPKEFQAQNPLPLKNYKPWKISISNPYPWGIPGILDKGAGEYGY
jgi:hypothetical protein